LIEELRPVPEPGQRRVQPLLAKRRLGAFPVLGWDPCVPRVYRPGARDRWPLALELVPSDVARLEAEQGFGQGSPELDQVLALAQVCPGMYELDEARAEAGIEPPDHLTELMGDPLEVAHHEVLPIREQAAVEPP